MERYWHLVSTLKNIPYDPILGEAHRWLVEGLRWRVAREGAAAEVSSGPRPATP